MEVDDGASSYANGLHVDTYGDECGEWLPANKIAAPPLKIRKYQGAAFAICPAQLSPGQKCRLSGREALSFPTTVMQLFAMHGTWSERKVVRWRRLFEIVHTYASWTLAAYRMVGGSSG